MFSFKKIFKAEGFALMPGRRTEHRNFRIPLMGEKAPSFTCESTAGKFTFPYDYGTCWKILLSHPLDFTPVCSTELIELAALQEEFDKIGTVLCAVSTDPLEIHKQWKTALEKIEYKNNSQVKINFPIIDDSSLEIAKLYGMIHRESDNNRDVRGVFIIDPDNIIRAEFFYPMEVGRNMEELFRTVYALQTADEHRVMTPANWKAGNDVIVPFPVKGRISAMSKDSGEYYQFSWFMIFKRGISGISKRQTS
jgi:peroxiredoxin (alkyl hydroperoxide reductase subunit C)